ncbi:TPA: DNA-protecting protein DprA [Candidatus Saccharibacteria bacterium]|nr:DNA-protecting protein DprA [Candidatus Saccharibacteria bacterium]
MKINTISPDEQNFIQILTHIANAPKSLDYTGTLPTERVPTVAIVGTRKPTGYGRDVTHKIAFELASRGVVVVSGLALGVDSIAHKAALEAGGTTIAVLGCGLPRIYPSSHKGLADEIVKKGGAVMSEYERDEEARPHYFLERNRIVSGLADAIIITEAAAKSGTLNTAAHALEQGKEIFVVPGNITSPLSSGCNELLKQGAAVLTSYQDVLDVIAPGAVAPQTRLALGSTPAETAIIQQLSSGMRDGEAIQKATKLPAAEFATTLTMLEIAGVVRNLGSNQWTLR